MELYYVANARIPTEKAHGLQIMQMCAAFARRGVGIELIVARRGGALSDDPFAWYGIAEHFPITRVPILDFATAGIAIPHVTAPLQGVIFGLSVWWQLRRRPRHAVFTRDIPAAFLLSFAHRVILESHTFPARVTWLHRWMYRRMAHVVVITDQLRQRYIAAGVSAERLSVAPDGVDPDRFVVTESPETCRTALGLPTDKYIVMYTGNLFRWKGVYTLADASRQLGDQFLIVVVGGSASELKDFRAYIEREQLTRVMIVGTKPPTEIPRWLHAADVVVLPNSGIEPISRWYTSPLKLFEYMAAEKPIIASDLPSIREVLDEQTARLVPADDASALALAIMDVEANSGVALQRAAAARKQVGAYTWDGRAEQILSHF